MPVRAFSCDYYVFRQVHDVQTHNHYLLRLEDTLVMDGEVTGQHNHRTTVYIIPSYKLL